MKTLHVSGEFGWLYIASWTIMVSFGYNTSAMAQRYFSVDDERSARKIALLCCGLFFAGAFLWFIPPMAMRVVYPELPRMGLPNASEAAYAVASLTLAAAWPDRSHVGGHVQRDHGQSFRPVQREIGDPHQGCLSIIVPEATPENTSCWSWVGSRRF